MFRPLVYLLLLSLLAGSCLSLQPQEGDLDEQIYDFLPGTVKDAPSSNQVDESPEVVEESKTEQNDVDVPPPARSIGMAPEAPVTTPVETVTNPDGVVEVTTQQLKPKKKWYKKKATIWTGVAAFAIAVAGGLGWGGYVLVHGASTGEWTSTPWRSTRKTDSNVKVDVNGLPIQPSMNGTLGEVVEEESSFAYVVLSMIFLVIVLLLIAVIVFWYRNRSRKSEDDMEKSSKSKIGSTKVEMANTQSQAPTQPPVGTTTTITRSTTLDTKTVSPATTAPAPAMIKLDDPVKKGGANSSYSGVQTNTSTTVGKNTKTVAAVAK